jgi:hypothetical protein
MRWLDCSWERTAAGIPTPQRWRRRRSRRTRPWCRPSMPPRCGCAGCRRRGRRKPYSSIVIDVSRTVGIHRAPVAFITASRSETSAEVAALRPHRSVNATHPVGDDGDSAGGVLHLAADAQGRSGPRQPAVPRPHPGEQTMFTIPRPTWRHEDCLGAARPARLGEDLRSALADVIAHRRIRQPHCAVLIDRPVSAGRYGAVSWAHQDHSAAWRRSRG